MVRNIRLFLGISVIFCALFFIVQNAQAITLIPPSIELQVKPGQPYDTLVKLFNETPDAIQLYAEARSFTAQGETGIPTFDFDAPIEGAALWFKVTEDPIPLAPGERYEVPVVINVPQDAEPGGHYVAVFFSNNPPQGEGGGQVAIGSKIGTLFLVRVEGDVIEQGDIKEFVLEDGKGTLNRLPAQFAVRFENTGNVHLRPTGTLTIANMFGNKVNSLEVNPGKGATLPGQIRRYEAIWEKGQVQETTGNAWSAFWKEFTNEWNNFAVGKFNANLTLAAGTTTAIEDSELVSFWVIPWRVLLVFALAALIVIILLIVFIKRYNAWILKRAQPKK